MKKVFISHPFKNNPERNREKTQRICKELMKGKGKILPISPLHLFSFMKNESDNFRNEIMLICFRLIDLCDEVWVYGNSEGCKFEKQYAEKQDKTVRIKY